MDHNLNEIASYYLTPADLQAAIDACRARLPTLTTQEARDKTRESIANYLRIAQCRRWSCA